MQQPPPYRVASDSVEQYPAPEQALLKPGAPMQAAYPANPECTPPNPAPIFTTTTTRTVVQQQPPAVMFAPGYIFRELPVNMQCLACKTQIVTATEYVPGSLTWLACFGLAAVGLIGGCCVIPFCIDEMKDVNHSCPNCRTVLGIYRRL